MAVSIAALEILEEADFAPASARAIAKAIEASAAMNREDLATKSDLVELRQGLAEFRQQARADLSELKVEVHKNIGEVAFRMYLSILAQIAVTLGATYFIFTNIR